MIVVSARNYLNLPLKKQRVPWWLSEAMQVLMQTATAVVENSQSTLSVPVPLILDSVSQRSYITDKLAKGL